MLSSTISAFGASFDSFADAKGHWAEATLKRAVAENILNGSNGKLEPNGGLKGSEMLAIMVRQLNLQTYRAPYPGTSENDWFYRYAAIAAESGLITAEDNIDMNATVTREQVFIVFANAFFTQADFDKALKNQKAELAAKEEASKNAIEATGLAMEASKNAIETTGSAMETWQTVTETSKPAIEAEQKPEQKGLDRFADADKLSLRGRAAAQLLTESGLVQGDDLKMLNPQKGITRAEFVTMLFRSADSRDAVICDEGMIIALEAPDVDPGAMVKATAKFSGISDTIKGDIQWYLDGAIKENFRAEEKDIINEMTSAFSANIEFKRNMNLFRRVGIEVDYYDKDENVVHKYAEKVVTVTNYNPEHYWGELYKEAKATVSCVYKGNYTSSYNIDYSTEIKEAFINGQGYSSRTEYLAWINLATQKVNIFKGKKGDWELIKTFRCATGAKSTPTPVGVTYVTYKQNAWYHPNYICKPIVRFYPGTGYAFHSVLFDPKGSGRVIDGSMGFPISHGCIRMMPNDIQWIHSYIPVNTTVVVY